MYIPENAVLWFPYVPHRYKEVETSGRTELTGRTGQPVAHCFFGGSVFGIVKLSAFCSDGENGEEGERCEGGWHGECSERCYKNGGSRPLISTVFVQEPQICKLLCGINKKPETDCINF